VAGEGDGDEICEFDRRAQRRESASRRREGEPARGGGHRGRSSAARLVCAIVGSPRASAWEPGADAGAWTWSRPGSRTLYRRTRRARAGWRELRRRWRRAAAMGGHELSRASAVSGRELRTRPPMGVHTRATLGVVYGGRSPSAPTTSSRTVAPPTRLRALVSHPKIPILGCA
jgi:hypothetical protein